MPKQQQYDYALDCTDCGRMYVFGSRDKRDEALVAHQSHDTDLFLQARV